MLRGPHLIQLLLSRQSGLLPFLIYFAKEFVCFIFFPHCGLILSHLLCLYHFDLGHFEKTNDRKKSSLLQVLSPLEVEG